MIICVTSKVQNVIAVRELMNLTGTTKNIFLQRYFHEESNDWIKKYVSPCSFFCFGDFSENPEKNKDYNKCCLPFQPIFLFVYALCISLGGDIAIID